MIKRVKNVIVPSYFKEDLYFASPDQIYMYNLKAHLDYCFVKPINNKNNLNGLKTEKNVGILKYNNSSLEAARIEHLVILLSFTPRLRV